ncbi:MAG TPA: cation-transporting P-type ATPase, partial [Ramlibacter sp.]|nr:cation-transporting P-type ATPase [Ramlibacter sp.]
MDARPAIWWQQDEASALREAAASAQGLSDAEAAQRLQRWGANRLAPPRRRRLVDQIAHRLRDPMVLVLLAAGAVSLLTGESASAGIIAAMVLLSVVLDQVQQSRAETAAQRLSETVALRARALRGGQEREVDVASLVPGDVVRLAAGSLVPADGLLLAAQDLFVRQAALTGESFPVEKKAGARGEGTGLDQAHGALFMGSSVLSGT